MLPIVHKESLNKKYVKQNNGYETTQAGDLMILPFSRKSWMSCKNGSYIVYIQLKCDETQNDYFTQVLVFFAGIELKMSMRVVWGNESTHLF